MFKLVNMVSFVFRSEASEVPSETPTANTVKHLFDEAKLWMQGPCGSAGLIAGAPVNCTLTEGSAVRISTLAML